MFSCFFECVSELFICVLNGHRSHGRIAVCREIRTNSCVGRYGRIAVANIIGPEDTDEYHWSERYGRIAECAGGQGYGVHTGRYG